MADLDFNELLAHSRILEQAGDLSRALEILLPHTETASPMTEWVWFEVALKSRKLNRSDYFLAYSARFLDAPKVAEPGYRNGRITLLRHRIVEKSLTIGDRIAAANQLLELSGTEKDIELVESAEIGIKITEMPLMTSDETIIVEANRPPLAPAKLITADHYLLDVARERSAPEIKIDVCRDSTYIYSDKECAIVKGQAFFSGLSSSINIKRLHEELLSMGRPTQLGGRAVVLQDYFGGDNYCHFTLDWLTRLIVAERHLGSIDYACGNIEGFSWQRDLLEAVTRGGASRLVNTGARGWLAFDEIVVVQNASIDRLHPAFWGDCDVLEELRRRVFEWFEINETKPHRRILISRRDAGGRRGIVNENELETALTAFGFSTVALTEMSVADQARIFCEAEVVIGVHGAGLTNALYMQPGTQLVEIAHNRYGTSAFYRLASSRSVNYAAMSCASSLSVDVEATRAHSHTNDYPQASVAVNVDALLHFLRQTMAA